MQQLPPELVAQIGRFLTAQECSRCRDACKLFDTIGHSFIGHVFPLDCSNEYIRAVRKCKPYLTNLLIKLENIYHDLDLAQMIRRIRAVFPTQTIIIFIVYCTRPDRLMSLLPPDETNIRVNIEWLLTNVVVQPDVALDPALMTSHPIDQFVARYCKLCSFLSYEPFVRNIRSLTIGDGSFFLDFSKVDVDITTDLKYVVTYNGTPEITDAYKITHIHSTLDDKPPHHVLKYITRYKTDKMRLREIRTDGFFHYDWAYEINSLPATVQYVGTVKSPQDIYMIDFFHRHKRDLVFRVVHLEEYQCAVAANFITGYNTQIIRPPNLTVTYSSIADLWDHMSLRNRATWGVIMHLQQK